MATMGTVPGKVRDGDGEGRVGEILTAWPTT
jgi:hypothetical protein